MHDLPVAEPKSRRVRRTTGEVRALILAAARAVFAEKGFAGATTRMIAVRAQVAEPLIFNNFGSKTELFAQAVIEPLNTRFDEFVAQSEAPLPDREQRSAEFVHALHPFLRDNADLLLALVKSGDDSGTEKLRGLNGYFARGEARMRAQYEEAGLEFDLPPGLIVRYSFAMLAGAVLFHDWFFARIVPDEAVAESTLARMVFKASEPRRP